MEGMAHDIIVELREFLLIDRTKGYGDGYRHSSSQKNGVRKIKRKSFLPVPSSPSTKLMLMGF
jgi:hypothetical protein